MFMSSLDLSPKPQSQHPTASSVTLLQCVTDFSSLPHPACTTFTCTQPFTISVNGKSILQVAEAQNRKHS